MKQKYRVIIIAVTAFFMFINIPKITFADQKDKLIIGTDTNYVPFEFLDKVL